VLAVGIGATRRPATRDAAVHPDLASPYPPDRRDQHRADCDDDQQLQQEAHHRCQSVAVGSPFESDRCFMFAMPPEDLWALIEDPAVFPRWWPWLRRLEAKGLLTGDRWRCTVQPPLPYQVAFTIALDDVEAPRRAEATISGDIIGHAVLTIGPHPEGCEARLVSSLAPAHSLLRAVASVARPLVRFGHDWVLDQGARQFARHAIAGRERG
jgi:uncharacterized protein YndB with AHSA1/START domain